MKVALLYDLHYIYILLPSVGYETEGSYFNPI